MSTIDNLAKDFLAQERIAVAGVSSAREEAAATGMPMSGGLSRPLDRLGSARPPLLDLKTYTNAIAMIGAVWGSLCTTKRLCRSDRIEDGTQKLSTRRRRR